MDWLTRRARRNASIANNELVDEASDSVIAVHGNGATRIVAEPRDLYAWSQNLITQIQILDTQYSIDEYFNSMDCFALAPETPTHNFLFF